jgi:GGDEF domain-containing protein
MLILPDIKTANALPLLARRIQKTLKPPLRWRGRSLSLSIRMGICLFPGHGEDVDTLMKNAEAAFDRAGAAGEGFRVFSA